MKNKSIVVLGGTFNPLSKAHGTIIKFAKKQVNAEKMILLPTSEDFFFSWKKFDKSQVLPESLRLKILNEYSKRNKGTEIELCEVNKITEKTIDSLNYIQNKYPNYQISFIFGNEKFEELERWYKPDEILKKYRIIVFSRVIEENDDVFNHSKLLSKYKDSFMFFGEIKKIEGISSTLIREAIRKKDKPLLRKLTYNYVIRILEKEKFL